MDMYYCGFLLAATLLGGCRQETTQPSVELPPNRVVATVYAANADTGDVACHRAPDATAPIVTLLRNGQLADLVSQEEGTFKRGEEYWLHVYPRLGHRPSCYINTSQLVPVS
ncbi:MAG: hypothetical protein KJ914_14710 [Gammaproteobacteria bacterium]|nr:hypothetical protein [Gammaproteobacteria bacterium]MBU1725459.1 hypothetical protein [Gammaproteobacteria bacterium]MBU2005804.1 hypothetical protein [Gammaproteobacteria bacterium]